MRDNTVTYSKAIAMMLVVLGHAFYGTYVQHWVNMFHVPVFFFMSGYCFKETHLEDIKTFVFKKFQGIYWPFLKWSLIFLLLHNVFYRLGIYNSTYGFAGGGSALYSSSEMLREAGNIIFRMANPELLLGPYWFLESFFVGTFIFFFTILFFKKLLKIDSTIIPGALLLAASLAANYFNLAVYLLNYRELMTAFFIWTGYAYKKSGLNIHSDKRIWAVAVILISVGCICWQGEASSVSAAREIPFIVTAIFGTLLVFGVSTELAGREFKWLERIGSSTMTILTWHCTAFLPVTALIIAIYGLPHIHLAEYPVIAAYAAEGWGILYFAAGILIPMALAACNKKIKSSWLKL